MPPCAGREQNYPSTARWHPEDDGLTLASTAAEPGRADPTTVSCQRESEMQGNSGAGHPKGMTKSDRATVGVHLGRVEAEPAGAGDTDGRKCLVDLYQVELTGL